VTFLDDPPRPVAVGADLFADELARQGADVLRLAWAPPADSRVLGRLVGATATIAEANAEALRRLRDARPVLADVAHAKDVIPGMDERTFLHAGPPIEWAAMTGPMRGGVVGAALLEGLADDPETAAARLSSGEVTFSPNHEHASVAPMAGIVSPSMPVWVVEDVSSGGRAFCPVNEGMGRVLRFGAFHREHIEHLVWMRDGMLPVLRSALRVRQDPVDLRSLIAQALQMGDECHNRHKAASALFLRELVPTLVRTEHPSGDVIRVVTDLAANEISFLNPTMAAAKATMDRAAGIQGSSIVTAMTRNGREFAIRMSGLPGRWFTGPASTIEGLYFAGYGPEDANPDMGDSAITETVGLGGFAVAASPAVLQTVGGTPEEALAITRSMYEIAGDEHPVFHVPQLGYVGTPLGIDARAVVHTGILPVINTGIAHREPGVGQVGAGVVRPPMQPFIDALDALSRDLSAGSSGSDSDAGSLV
jgi:hypothetical protein